MIKDLCKPQNATQLSVLLLLRLSIVVTRVELLERFNVQVQVDHVHCLGFLTVEEVLFEETSRPAKCEEARHGTQSQTGHMHLTKSSDGRSRQVVSPFVGD